MPLTAREIERMIVGLGGRLIRHGSAHDIFELVDGERVQVPRHPGDLSIGVERKLRKQLGLDGLQGQQGRKR